MPGYGRPRPALRLIWRPTLSAPADFYRIIPDDSVCSGWAGNGASFPHLTPGRPEPPAGGPPLALSPHPPKH